MVKVWISEITFSDNSTIPLNENDIILLVGPNNSGKSATLKDASKLLIDKNSLTKVLKSIKFKVTGSLSDLTKYLEQNSQKTYERSGIIYEGYGYRIDSYFLNNIWSRKEEGLSSLHDLFVQSLTTEERLLSVNPPESIKITLQPPKHPIHVLQKKDELENQFSSYFKMVFGTDLTIHRNAGREVPLLVGNKPLLKEGEDRVSLSYIERLEKLNLLHLQGDGMRSFVGVLLNVFVSTHSILLIDEPEAFLHPPQARLLGKMISKDLPGNRQLFLATHSEDFLKGLLDSSLPNLKVIRIQREDAVNKVCVLNSDDIKKVWEDSLLKHSNVLSGLFHTKVVICEGDSDCKFYSAILSALYEGIGGIAPDILFIHCGGKLRIPTALRALKKLDVPICIVADFDLINNEKPLKPIFEGLGGNWREIRDDWKLVKNEIGKRRPQLLTDEVKKEIEAILTSTNERIFPDDKITNIKTILRKASAWTEAKSIGKSYIPPGNATQAFERLQTKLKEKGLFILEVGELEGFDRSVGNKGPSWVNKVLEKNLKEAPELEAARNFVKSFIDQEIKTDL